MLNLFFNRTCSWTCTSTVPVELVLFPRIQIQVKYHLLSFLFFLQRRRTRHGYEGDGWLRRWRNEFRAPGEMQRSPGIVIVCGCLRPWPGRLFVLLYDVGDGINVKHHAERLRLPILPQGVRRISTHVLILRLCHNRLVIIEQGSRVQRIVIRAVSMYAGRREPKTRLFGC